MEMRGVCDYNEYIYIYIPTSIEADSVISGSFGSSCRVGVVRCYLCVGKE